MCVGSCGIEVEIQCVAGEDLRSAVSNREYLQDVTACAPRVIFDTLRVENANATFELSGNLRGKTCPIAILARYGSRIFVRDLRILPAHLGASLSSLDRSKQFFLNAFHQRCARASSEDGEA
jgi:hypothetical protein